jgi:ribonuclease Y
MNPTIITVIAAIVALFIGIVAGKLIFNKDTAKLVEDAESQADRIVKDAQSQAETMKEKKMLEAKERFLQLKSEHEKDVLQRSQKVVAFVHHSQKLGP